MPMVSSLKVSLGRLTQYADSLRNSGQQCVSCDCAYRLVFGSMLIPSDTRRSHQPIVSVTMLGTILTSLMKLNSESPPNRPPPVKSRRDESTALNTWLSGSPVAEARWGEGDDELSFGGDWEEETFPGEEPAGACCESSHGQNCLSRRLCLCLLRKVLRQSCSYPEMAGNQLWSAHLSFSAHGIALVWQPRRCTRHCCAGREADTATTPDRLSEGDAPPSDRHAAKRTPPQGVDNSDRR